MSAGEPLRLAKLSWSDPETGAFREYFLIEDAKITIGRSSNNDICIPDRHVSRLHAIIEYRDGIFMISDNQSANGTFVNDLQLTEPYPLASGDQIKLYVPLLTFSSVENDTEARRHRSTGTLVGEHIGVGNGKLIISSGPQEGHVIPLLLQSITIGRAISNATWEIGLQDPAVSRPHAKIERINADWVLIDLGSSNGTYVNESPVDSGGRVLKDGDQITMGATMVLYRAG